MTTVTIKGAVVYDASNVRMGMDPWRFVPFSDPGHCFFKEYPESIFVAPHTVTVEVPADFDPRQLQIAALRKKEQDARAAFSALCTEIQRQIASLQAIEHQEAA